MKLPIAILFANLKGNIGDFAILHAMLRDLAAKYPGHPLDVFPHGFYREDASRLAAFEAGCAVDFQIAGHTYKGEPMPWLAQQGVRALGLWPLAQRRSIRTLADAAATDAARFRDYEAIFLAGGEHWGGTSGAISMFGTLNAIHRHNPKIYAYPFSVNPKMLRFNARSALVENFRKIGAPLVPRDGLSKALLDRLGLDVVQGADCVHTLQDLADDVAPAAARYPGRILVAVTGSRRRLGRALQAACAQLRAAGRDIALLTTCAPEDQAAFQPVARALGIPYLAPQSWQAAVAEMKASSLLITNRLHGLILGTLADTALLPVTDRKKAEAFVKDAAMPFSAASLAAVTPSLVSQCLENREEIRTRAKLYQRNSAALPRAPVIAPPPLLEAPARIAAHA
jgi:polysaccharide pyruvyl transferase WcaK-like protein